MKHLIVIPARGGSKGIPKKNIYPVCGKPLLEYTLEAVLEAGISGDVVVSTDSQEIAAVAEKYSGVIPIRRPDELSGDTASTEIALIHALDYMKEHYGRDYETVITMQPTSPLRRSSTIRNFVQTFESVYCQFDSQLSFTESRSDYWIKNQQGEFQRLFPDAPRRRQERNPLYVENSCLYITKSDVLRRCQSVLGQRVNCYVISEIEGVDINEPNDIKLAEFYLQLVQEEQEQR